MVKVWSNGKWYKFESSKEAEKFIEEENKKDMLTVRRSVEIYSK